MFKLLKFAFLMIVIGGVSIELVNVAGKLLTAADDLAVFGGVLLLAVTLIGGLWAVGKVCYNFIDGGF